MLITSCTWTPGGEETLRLSAFCFGSSPCHQLLLSRYACTATITTPRARSSSCVCHESTVSHCKLINPPSKPPCKQQLDLDLIPSLLLDRPNLATLASILRLCASSKALHHGKLVHKHINSRGFHRNVFISNWLVLMYADCESMQDAQEAFDQIPRPNSYSWSILIKGYAKNGELDKATTVFSRIPQPDVCSWNTMIAAYAQEEKGKQALELFWRMQEDGVEPSKVTFICTLEAFSSLTSLEEFQKLYSVIRSSKYADDVLVKTALLTVLGKFRNLEEAWGIFSTVANPDIVAWNAIISAYTQNGDGRKALNLFRQMQLQDMLISEVTFVCVLDACTSLVDLEEGQRIHACSVLNACESHAAVGNALIHMYGKCGYLNAARHSFNRLPFLNVVSWTALMTACVGNHENKEALFIYSEMQQSGISPTEVTFVCVTDACANLAAIEEGLVIHAAIVKRAYDEDALVGTALVHMYGKCGLVSHATSVFKRISKKDAAAWNAMLTACAQSGQGEETLVLFNEMQLAGGFMPNIVSFTCVLTVCSHMGWVDEARKCFMSLCAIMQPTVEHCSCMIDLLGRAGCLEEAEDLLEGMPVGNLAPIWTSLVVSCKIHGDLQCGLRAADYFSELHPMDPAPFVMMGNICSVGDV